MNNTTSAANVDSVLKSNIQPGRLMPSAGTRARSRRGVRRVEGSMVIARAVENLESRRLFAVDPGLSVFNYNGIAGALGNGSAQAAFSNPTVAVDPRDPLKMVAVSGVFAANTPNGSVGTSLMLGAFSLNGGSSWATFPILGNALVTDLSTANFVPYTVVSDISVGFDLTGSFYITSLQRNNDGTSGAVVFEKFTLASPLGSTPTEVDLSPLDGTTPAQILYTWVGSSGPGGQVAAVMSPTMTISQNATSVTNIAGATITDTSIIAGQSPIYVAWASVANVRTTTANVNPNHIYITGSNDGGLGFSAPERISGNFNASNARNTAPKIIVNQGITASDTVGGMVTVVWTDANSGSSRNQDDILSRRYFPSTGTQAETAAGGTVAIGATVLGVTTPSTFDQTFNMTVGGADLLTVDTISVITSVSGDLATLSADLISPSGTLILPLFQASNQGTLGTVGTRGISSGTNLGTVFVNNTVRRLGVEFSDDALRRPAVNEVGVAGGNDPYTGSFRAEGDPLGLTSFEALVAAATAANDLNGTWTIRFSNFNTTSGNNATVGLTTLKFGSGLAADADPTTGGTKSVTQAQVSPTGVRTGLSAGTYVGVVPAAAPNAGTQLVSPDAGFGPGVVVAVDNTLGTRSRAAGAVPTTTRGRIYLAYTGRDATVGGNPADNTDIFLTFSDNAGVTWQEAGRAPTTPAIRVNNDDGLTDGFSGAAENAAGFPILGRPQFQPSIAVDQTTGDVAVSWYDARWDAARARVATYVGVSRDGGNTFEQTFANVPNAATDAVTGANVNLGPTPDNFTVNNQNRAAFNGGTQRQGFGTASGLAFVAGRVYPVWIGNDNGGQVGNVASQIVGNSVRSSVIASGAGPRIIASDMGAVVAPTTVFSFAATSINPAQDTVTTLTYNGSLAADGRRMLSGFTVTFDREVDVTTFTTNSIQVWYRSPDMLGTSAGTLVPVQSVTPLFAQRVGISSQAIAESSQGIATRFLIQLAAPQGNVGTYSYTILPTVRDTSVFFGLHDYAVNTFAATGAVAVTGATTNAITGAVTAGGVGSSVATLAGVPATQIVLSARVLVSGSVAAGGSLSNVALDLLSPGGNTLSLATVGSLTGTTLTNQVFTVPAGVIKEGALNNWTLVVTNSNTAVGSISAFSVQLVTADSSTAATVTGQAMDQNRDGLSGVAPELSLIATPGNIGSQVSFSAGDIYAVPSPVNGTTVQSNFSVIPTYDNDSRPLIIPGPYLVSATPVLTAPIGTAVQTGSVTNYTTGATTSGVVVNGTTSALDVRFDRDILPTSFTRDKILAITGPSGTVNGPQRYTSGDQNVAISDQRTPSVVLESRLVINDDYPIGDLDVQLSITHPSVRDLRISLVSPTGVVVPLVNGGDLKGTGGAGGTNLTNTLFDDAATLTINDVNAVAPYQRPQGFRPTTSVTAGVPASTLAALNLLNVKGVWKLRVEDTATGSTGTLNYWSLLATPDVSAFTVTQPDAADFKRYRISFPTQRLSGTYTVGLASTIVSRTSTLGSVAEGLDSSLDAGLNRLRTSAATSLPQTSTYTSTNIPVVITSTTTTTPITSVISLPALPSINDISVQLNISYANDPDLTVELVSPNNVTVRLFSNVGNTGTRINFQDTVFTTSTTATPIANGSAPFLGTFRPAQPLTTLVGQTVNIPAGDWKLNIFNAGTAGLQGVLNTWNLKIVTPLPTNNLGEPTADSATASFRIYQFAANNPQSSNQWTAFGPNPEVQQVKDANGNVVSTRAWSGRIGGVAVDNSDPTGNTVFAAGASGGVWKTRNFLTRDAAGPTWVPLTDFGPTSTLTVGSIAVYARNNDVNQSIIFAGTGEGDSGTPGIGFIRSLDGGQTWDVLDSRVNVDSTGGLLPLINPTGSTARDHAFVGATTYRVVVDPNPTPSGDVVVYAALGGGNGLSGIWRSTDTGNNWTLVRTSTVNAANAATDVSLDLASGFINTLSNPTGNIQFLYAAFAGDGIYFSGNRGTTWSALPGRVGNPLKVDPTRTNPTSGQTPTDNPADSPNGAKQRITLARPTLTGNSVRDSLYQGWMYALVADSQSIVGQNPAASDLTAADLDGIYMTKDFGQNWTKLSLRADRPFAGSAGAIQDTAIPTNNTAAPTNATYTDAPFLGNYFENTGNDNQSLAVDPQNPSILYVGGRQFYRVDTTAIADPHSLYLSPNYNDGGLLSLNVSGPAPLTRRVNLAAPGSFTVVTNDANGNVVLRSDPILDPVYGPYVNLVQNPFDPFKVNSTIRVSNVDRFTNTGFGVTWTPLGTTELEGSLGHHELIATVDPTTGRTRLIFGDDQGIFTGVYDADGTSFTGTSQTTPVVGSRGGNLQIGQLYYGAVDPGLASQVASVTNPQRSYFYTSGKDIGGPRTTAGVDVLNTGNFSWNSPDAKNGGGVAVDQTGSGAFYQYFTPTGGIVDFTSPNNVNGPNFFYVRDASAVSGLFQTGGVGVTNLSGDPQWGDNTIVNFGVNPINNQEVVIASATGRLYATGNQGRSWSVIAEPNQIGLNNTLPTTNSNPRVPAIAYGAPDPAQQGGQTGATGFHIYAGTSAVVQGNTFLPGRVFVTFTGGGSGVGALAWINLDQNGLDGTTVKQIVTSPQRGSHEVYVTTEVAVYYMADSSVTGATWTRIASLLPTTLPSTASASSRDLGNISINGFGDPNQSSPRVDFNATTGNFNTLNSIQADWRYRIPDPAVGTNAATGAHPVLYVSGDGGVFRSADNGRSWSVFPNVSEDDSRSDGGGLPNVSVTDLDLSTGPVDPITGFSDASRGENLLMATTFGRGTFAIRVAPLVTQLTTADATRPDPTLQPTVFSGTNATPTFTGFSAATAFGNKVRVKIFDLSDPLNPIQIGGGTQGVVTDNSGRFSVQVDAGRLVQRTNPYILGVQATQVDPNNNDAAVIVSPFSRVSLTLDTTAPSAPVITSITPDSGSSGTDGITNNGQPLINGTGEVGATVRVSLNGALQTTAAPILVNNAGLWGFTPSARLADGTYLVTATQSDAAGNVSVVSNTFTLVIRTVRPATPTVPVLLAADDSGVKGDSVTSVTTPRITGTVLADSIVTLFSGATQLGATVLSDANGVYTFTAPTLPAGTYNITATVTDLAGNVSTASPILRLQIVTAAPAAPAAPVLSAADDTGLLSTDGITSVTAPRYTGVALSNAFVDIFVGGTQVTSTTSTATGSYAFQLPTALADGQYTITVRQRDVADNTSAFSGSTALTVDTTAPIVTATGVAGTKNIAFSNQVATYTDVNPGGAVQITWGDGNSSAGTDTAGTPRVITGTNTFARSGIFNYSVQVVDLAGNSGTGTGEANIVGQPVNATGGLTFNATEAQLSASQIVASFTDGLGAELVGSYSATIDWGDGTAHDTAATIVQPTAGVNLFNVLGSHRYGEDGTYVITVIIRTGGLYPSTPVTSTAIVVNTSVTLTPTAFTGTAGQQFTGEVATFIDTGDLPTAADFSGTIAWGDGTTSDITAITQDTVNPNLFRVFGTHTYAEGPQNYAPVVTVLNKGVNPAQIATSATIANGLPSASVTGQSTVFSGAGAVFTFSATDPSPSDVAAGFTYSINFGDGTAPVSIAATTANGSGVDFTKVYAAAGSYTITVTATDRNGGVSVVATKVVAVAAAPVVTGATANGAAFNPAVPLNEVNQIAFNLASATAGTTLPQLTTANLTLIRNGFDEVPLATSTFTFDTATGAALFDASSLDLGDGDYELLISVPNAPRNSVSFSRLAGDFNGDSIVDSRDTSLLRRALGTTTGQTGFIAAGDYSGNGVIDRDDQAFQRTLNGHRLFRTVRTVNFDPRRPIQRIPVQSFSGRAGSAIYAQDVIIRNLDTTRTVTLSDILFTGATSTLAFKVVGAPSDATTVTIAAGGSVRIRTYFRPVSVGTFRASASFGIAFAGTSAQFAVIESSATVRR